MEKAPCPHCGYENRASAIQCGLCRAILKPEGKRAEQARRRTEKRSSFFAEQAANRRNSNMLLLALTSMLTALGAVIGHLYGFPLEGAVIAFIIASALGAFSWFSGARLVLSMSGARKITHDGHPALFNVVEEMKVASGLPMPEVYIIESAAPNAFATGRDPSHSAVAVTRGLLEKLNRDELQGVIAHEMSHVRNFDIRYAMLAGVIVGATALIADAFLRGVFRGGGRKSHPAMLAVALIFAVLAPISAKILQMAISRRRELLADASAVQLTRNPDGLASALYKIWKDPEPLEAANRATQHMYIVNPVKSFSMKSKALLSTHPPMEARLKALKSMGAMGDYGV